MTRLGARRRSSWRLLFWLLLALPAAAMLVAWSRGALPMDLERPSGETAVRLMILALLPGPLIAFFGPNAVLRGWLAGRRNLGVAAFCYAVLHLAFYVMDMAIPAAMVEELTIPGIWTGWLALVLLTVPAAISFDAAMRRLGRRWKRLQALVYAALALTLAHWLLLDFEWLPALLHILPLAIAWCLRIAARGGYLSSRRFIT